MYNHEHRGIGITFLGWLEKQHSPWIIRTQTRVLASCKMKWLLIQSKEHLIFLLLASYRVGVRH